MLPGYKTYIVAVGMLLYQALGYLVYDQPIDPMRVMEAVGLGTLRAGMKRSL